MCLSGGASSTALLHLIKEGLQENSHKKLRFDPVFLYVDGMFVLFIFSVVAIINSIVGTPR